MKDLREKLNSIKEGRSEQILEESAVLGSLTVIAAMAAFIGLIVYNIKEDIKEAKANNKFKFDMLELKKKREEYIKLHPKDKLIKEIKLDIKTIVNKLKTDPNIKKKIKESVNIAIKEYNLRPNESDYEIHYSEESGYTGTDDYIEIIDASQDVRIELSWLLDDIITTLELKYKEPISLGIVKISSGDGDEGCIYIE